MGNSRKEEIAALARQIRARLDWYREEGVDSWPRLAASKPTPPPPEIPTPADIAVSSLLSDVPSGGDLLPLVPPSKTLEEIRGEIGDCQRCKLCSTRKNIVFGTGDPNASLMFVGEAPGQDEDLQGKPFVGRAGQLLTKMIEAMGLSRETVYIANIIKCRPPENRNPQPDEIAACRPFLEMQIAAIRPKVVCALGTFSAQTLLGTQQKISALRGKFHDYRGVKVLPTFHPAYLLRNPSEKKSVWEDLKKIMEELKKMEMEK
ncbi:MAG: uracil-DNA glycosylase [Nitrospirae bacterium]|nr:uracil-DNA glycosylase [Candidatus Manganitrophaceae bacterium]